MHKIRRTSALLLLDSLPAAAQLSQNMQDWLRRVNSPEFSGGRGAGGRGGRGGPDSRWVDGGAGYTAAERGEIVRYDTATGSRQVLMTAAQLTPPQLGAPLAFGEYTSTAEGKHMLFATNPRPTMIRK